MTATTSTRRALFDVWSRVYDLPPVQRAIYEPVHDAVSARLRGDAPGRVLDLGCGTGILTDRLRRDGMASVLVGCDLSLGMLEQAVGRSSEPAWVQGDATRLPFAGGSFDTAVSTEAFHWIPDQPAALRELHRVLRPGGRIVLAFVNPAVRGTSRAAEAFSRVAGQPAHWPTRRGMRRMCEQAGFEVVAQDRVRRVFSWVVPTIVTVAVRR
jgi:ubiquinone/menaquinone biosynthesis C-methylase UbiE